MGTRGVVIRMGHPLAYTLHIDVFSNVLRHNKRMIHLITTFALPLSGSHSQCAWFIW